MWIEYLKMAGIAVLVFKVLDFSSNIIKSISASNKEKGRTLESKYMSGVVYNILEDVVAHIANGDIPTVSFEEDLMTTEEASEEIGVSRPTIIRLLESGKIKYRMAGKHRRILFKDLMEYKLRRMESKHKKEIEGAHV